MSNRLSVNMANVQAVVLAGCRDFGRCPIASRLPAALWPIVDRPALEHLLAAFLDQGVQHVTVCSCDEGSLLQQSIQTDNRLKVEYTYEPLPVGTAGCIRDAVHDQDGKDMLLLVCPANIVHLPKLDVLIDTHIQSGSDLTVVFNPVEIEGFAKPIGEAAGIYVCSPDILAYVPHQGYCDVKEGLIPEMLRLGKTVNAATLPMHVGNYRGWREYLRAISNYLKDSPQFGAELRLYDKKDSHLLWVSADVQIDPSAKMFGPCIILNGARICEDVVIIGPTVVGRNVCVEKRSVVANSIVWDGAQVGRNCEVQRCIVDYGAVVRSKTVVREKSIPSRAEGMFRGFLDGGLRVVETKVDRLKLVLQSGLARIDKRLPGWIQLNKAQYISWFGVILVLSAFIWSYWPNLVRLWNAWQRSDEYSSGLLVPFLAVYVLWSRRGDITQCPISPSVWGVFAFIGAQAVRLFGLYFLYDSAERLSIVLSIAALVLLLFGWKLLRRVSTVLLFLCLMLPWPNRIQAEVMVPLQRWATSSAVFCLEVVGYGVVQEGNIIHIGESSVAVAEACNGLRMVTAFFVISGLVVLLVKRRWWEKLIVLASSLPIALLCNTIRLTLTAMAFTVVSGEYWEKLFHDFGGYAMMPLALAAVVAELWLLTRLIVLPSEQQPIVITRQER